MLTVGQGDCERRLEDPEELLVGYRTDDGLRYLDFEPTTPPDRLLPEDLAVTILINSRVGPAAFNTVQDHGAELDLGVLPETPLEGSSEADRDAVAELVAEVAGWPGFAASVATKVMHKKRPGLIPILDNQAIFGAYMNPRWPEVRSLVDSVYSKPRIRQALDWIHHDLVRPENAEAWDVLGGVEPTRSRIQLFDMVWWIYFRRLEPVKSRAD